MSVIRLLSLVCMYTHVQLAQLTNLVNPSHIHEHISNECNKVIVISVYVHTCTVSKTYMLSESKSHPQTHKD